MKRTPAPLIHTRCPRRRQEFRDNYREYAEAFYRAQDTLEPHVGAAGYPDEGCRPAGLRTGEVIEADERAVATRAPIDPALFRYDPTLPDISDPDHPGPTPTPIELGDPLPDDWLF